MKSILITGSNGLVGSETAFYFHALGWRVYGIDNNSRAKFFGAKADTRWNQQRLRELKNYTHIELDIRSPQIASTIESLVPDLIVHAAGQPSHDLAASMPVEDFEINALATLKLLEAVRQYTPETPFIFLSTNKVYGDSVNEITRKESATRFEAFKTVDENQRIDNTLHSLFGASKLSADISVQEYGKYFGLKTCCLRCGCLTGDKHSAVELHGFLAYMAKIAREGGIYKIFGHKGKQVRDNLHARDIACFAECFYENPRSGEVYNMGGGQKNSISILEALTAFSEGTGNKIQTEYHSEPRKGDHVVYISNLDKLHSHYPEWPVSISLKSILEQLCKTG